jgi:Ca2+-binding RTX toxin-like protein
LPKEGNLLTYGQSSALTNDFDFSKCEQVIIATLRGMLHGSITNDCLYGGKGNYILYGDLGYDMLNGKEGDYYLIGDSDNDKL